MWEVQEEQRKVLKEVDTILEDYCCKMSKKGKKLDIECLYGAANRLISLELEKAVAKAKQNCGNGDVKKTPTNVTGIKRLNNNKKNNPNSLLKPRHERPPIPIQPFSFMKNLKDLPSVMNSIREPNKSVRKLPLPKMNSMQLKNSRMNLLEALKKVKETQQEEIIKIEDESSSEDSNHVPNDGENDEKLNFVPLDEINDENDEDEIPAAIKNDFEFVGTIEIPDDSEENYEEISQKKVKNGSSSESSNDKSSRRSSDFEDLIVGQPDESLEDLGQERFLKYFGLYTGEQIDQLKTRRVSRRRRNCTSNVRKDFHYGQFDVNYVPVKNNKPVLYSPVDKARYPKRKQPEPMPIVGPASKIIISVPPTNLSQQQQQRRSLLRVQNIVEAAISKELKTCVACQQMSDVETMNACLLCYNFYHLQCHTMDRELRERENLCPDCLRQGLEKKKRRLELRKRLNFQVLQANHKASIAAAMQQQECQKIQT